MITEEDRVKAVERANSYRQMMEQWAWKDFKSILDQTRQSALERGINASMIEETQVQKGFVKCIDSIYGELNFILEGTGK